MKKIKGKFEEPYLSKENDLGMTGDISIEAYFISDLWAVEVERFKADAFRQRHRGDASRLRDGNAPKASF